MGVGMGLSGTKLSKILNSPIEALKIERMECLTTVALVEAMFVLDVRLLEQDRLQEYILFDKNQNIAEANGIRKQSYRLSLNQSKHNGRPPQVNVRKQRVMIDLFQRDYLAAR